MCCVCDLCLVQQVRSDARLLFDATILYATSKGPVSLNLILIKYHDSEDLNSARIHLELQ